MTFKAAVERMKSSYSGWSEKTADDKVDAVAEVQGEMLLAVERRLDALELGARAGLLEERLALVERGLRRQRVVSALLAFAVVGLLVALAALVWTFHS
jgi:hypothetical protein